MNSSQSPITLPVMTGARVSVEPNSDKACFFTYMCQFSRKNIEVEFWPKISDNIPTYKFKFLSTFPLPPSFEWKAGKTL